MLSFTSTGRPCSGPREPPSAASRSNRRASSIAASFVVQTDAISGSTTSIRASAAPTRSSLVVTAAILAGPHPPAVARAPAA